MCTKVPRQQTWSRVQQKEDLCPGDRKERNKVGGGKELEGWVKLNGMDMGPHCLK
jgi:hypothetical protein